MDIYNIPYTYVIGWTHLNKYYYGVRYARKCNPADLWITYFTSSKYVQQLRKKEGEPDIKEIRKTFDDSQSARLWEYKVLKRLNCVKDPKWLNQSNAGETFFSSEKPKGHQVGSKNSMFGKKRPDRSLLNKTRIHPLLDKSRPEHSELMKLNNPMKGTSIPFWTDEVKNVRQHECPGEGWRRGFVRKKKN